MSFVLKHHVLRVRSAFGHITARSGSVLALACVWAIGGAAAQGAAITWISGPTTITSPSQIAVGTIGPALTAQLVRAVNLGGTAETVTHPTAGPLSFVTIGSTVDTIQEAGNIALAGAFVGTTGDAGFDDVLNSFSYDGPDPANLTLGGLTAGQVYRIQLFVSDDRGCCSARTQNFDDADTGLPSGTFDHGSSPFVIGQFTASASSQIVEINGVAQAAHVLNGYALTSISVIIPEPTTGLLMTMGLVGLTLRRRRK